MACAWRPCALSHIPASFPRDAADRGLAPASRRSHASMTRSRRRASPTYPPRPTPARPLRSRASVLTARARSALLSVRGEDLSISDRGVLLEVVKDALLAGRAELLRGEQRRRARTRRASPRCVDRPRGARPQPILVLEGRQPRRPPALDTPNKTTTVARRRADVFDELCEPGGGDVSNGVRLAHLVEAPRSLEAALGLDDDFPPLVGARSG